MSAVDEQMCDSTTQVNTMSLGSAPAVALANTQVSTSQAISTLAHSAGEQVQQTSITQQTITLQGLNSLLSTGAVYIDTSISSTPEQPG